MTSGREQNRAEENQNGRSRGQKTAETEVTEGRDGQTGCKADREHRSLQKEEGAGVKMR